jgi:hypothetical protein
MFRTGFRSLIKNTGFTGLLISPSGGFLDQNPYYMLCKFLWKEGFTSLYSNANNRYGGRTARKISEFFNAMQLPEPSEGEYSETHDKGYLVFLNDPGVVIRITRANLTLWNHPRVLQPLGSVPAGKLRIDINPGIHCPATEKQRNEAMDDLGKDNLQLFDPALYNCGTLPAVEKLIKAGYAVALDPVAVDDISRTATWARKLLGSKFSRAATPAYDPQTLLYGHLRETFNRRGKTPARAPTRRA